MANRRTTSRSTGQGPVRALAGLLGRAAAFAVAWGVLATGAQAKGAEVGAEAAPEHIELRAVVRDFRCSVEAGGHDDFDRYEGDVRVGLVETFLGSDGKPILRSRSGLRLVSDFRDDRGRAINPAFFDADLGDRPGRLERRRDARVYTAAGFDTWFRDDPRANLARLVPLRLERDGNTYRFDSRVTEPYGLLGGYYPIDGLLFEEAGNDRNLHFTTEIEAEFIVAPGREMRITAASDDDLWVFVDGRLVIDLGSTHARHEQTIDLSRLPFLEAGEIYQIKVFHAERTGPESSLMLETTFPLRAVRPPEPVASR